MTRLHAHRRQSRAPHCFALLALLVATPLFAAGRARTVALVTDPLARRRAGMWPVTSGVPFPPGAAGADATFTLSVGGRLTPAQFRVLSKWDGYDGSVKWLLIDYLSRGQRPERVTLNVAAKPPARAVTQVGFTPITIRDLMETPAASEAAETPPAPVKVGIEVDTGPLRFHVREDRPDFLDGVWLDQNKDGKFSDDERMIGSGTTLEVVTVPAGNASGAETTYRSAGSSAGYKVQIEESGPVRAEIRISGILKADGGQSMFPWIVRIHAFGGQPHLRIEHTIIVDRDPENFSIKSIGLRHPIAFAPRKGNSGSVLSIQDSLEYPQYPLFNQFKPAHRIWDGASEGKTIRPSQNWAHYAGDRKGITIALRDAAKMYPAGWRVDYDNSTFAAYPWPPHPDGRILDLRRLDKRNPPGYDRYKQSAEYRRKISFVPAGMKPVGRNGTGVSRTHAYTYFFHRDASVKPADVGAAANDPLRAMATPETYCGSLAFGRIVPVAPQLMRPPRRPISDAITTVFPQMLNRSAGAAGWYDARCQDMFEWIWHHQNRWYHWYGWLTYGNIQSHFGSVGWCDKDNPPDRWWHYRGRWAWQNDEHFLGRGVWQMFARWGDRRVFIFSEALSRNSVDVMTAHSTRQSGWSHRHNVDPYNDWADPTHTYTVTRAYLHFLTGDRYARETILEAGDQFAAAGPRRFGSAAKIDRNFWLALYACMSAWEVTGDVKYKKAIDDAMDFVLTLDDSAYANRDFMYCGYLIPTMEHLWDMYPSEKVTKFFSKALKVGIAKNWHLKTWGGAQQAVAAFQYFVNGDRSMLPIIARTLTSRGYQRVIQPNMIFNNNTTARMAACYQNMFPAYGALVHAGLVRGRRVPWPGPKPK